MRTPDFPGDHTASDYTVTATYDQNGITHTLPVTAVAEGSSSFIVQIGGGTSIDAEGYDEVTVHVTRDTEAGSCVSLLQIDGGGITAKGIDGIVHVADASPATVATFTDGDPGAATGDFTADISWVQIDPTDPENSTTLTTTGTVVEDGHGGFKVEGTPPAEFLAAHAPFIATVEISGLGSSDSAITQLDKQFIDPTDFNNTVHLPSKGNVAPQDFRDKFYDGNGWGTTKDENNEIQTTLYVLQVPDGATADIIAAVNAFNTAALAHENEVRDWYVENHDLHESDLNAWQLAHDNLYAPDAPHEIDGLIDMKSLLQFAYEKSCGLEHGPQKYPNLDFEKKIADIQAGERTPD